MSVSVGIRMSDDTKNKLENLSVEYGVTKGDLIAIFVNELERGHFEIENGSLKGTEEYREVNDLGAGKLVEGLREKNYPDRVIKEMMDNFYMQIKDSSKYNARRSNEWGA